MKLDKEIKKRKRTLEKRRTKGGLIMKLKHEEKIKNTAQIFGSMIF